MQESSKTTNIQIFDQTYILILLLTLELSQRSKWLGLQFYNPVDPRLGIMVPDGLIISEIHTVTRGNSFCKKVVNQQIYKYSIRRII